VFTLCVIGVGSSFRLAWGRAPDELGWRGDVTSLEEAASECVCVCCHCVRALELNVDPNGDSREKDEPFWFGVGG